MFINAWFRKISKKEKDKIKINGREITSKLTIQGDVLTLIVKADGRTVSYVGSYDPTTWKDVVRRGKDPIPRLIPKKSNSGKRSKSKTSSSSSSSSSSSGSSSSSSSSGSSSSSTSSSSSDDESSSGPKKRTHPTRPVSGSQVKYYAYSDGGARPSSGGPGGYGSAIFAGVPKHPDKPVHEKHQAFPNATNGNMEMLGLAGVLKLITKLPKGSHVTVHVDATYVLDTIGRGVVKNPPTGWIKGWEAKGWRLAGGGPVKNLKAVKELWSIIPKIADDYHVECVHVKGHSNNYGNEYVDRLTWLTPPRLGRVVVTPPRTGRVVVK